MKSIVGGDAVEGQKSNGFDPQIDAAYSFTILKHIACLTVKVVVNYKRQRVQLPRTGSVFQYGSGVINRYCSRKS